MGVVGAHAAVGEDLVDAIDLVLTSGDGLIKGLRDRLRRLAQRTTAPDEGGNGTNPDLPPAGTPSASGPVPTVRARLNETQRHGTSEVFVGRRNGDIEG